MSEEQRALLKVLGYNSIAQKKISILLGCNARVDHIDEEVTTVSVPERGVAEVNLFGEVNWIAQ